MRYGEFVKLRRYGLKVAPIKAENKSKPESLADKKNLDICLNCEEPECKGYCKRIKN